MKMQVTKRLSVNGPDADGEYELLLTRDESAPEWHFITRAEADALIDALSIRDESGRLIAPPQSPPAERPAGPWDANTKP